MNMNQLSREKRKVIQISITKESEQILDSFTKKYGTPKSIVIERALQFLAAQYHRKIYLQYVICDDKSTENTTTTTIKKQEDHYEKTLQGHIDKFGAYSELSPEEEEEWINICNKIEQRKQKNG